MPERTVSVSLVADMSNYLAGMQRGSTATQGLGKQAQTTGQLTQQFVGKIGSSISTLGSQVGGTVGLLLNTVGNDLDKIAGKSANLATALTVGGGAAVAAGVGLEQLGSGAIQATEQLNAAVTASGDSVSDYSKKIEEAVSSNENLGHSAEDTKNALAALIPAAGSTQGALNQMGVVADLAAAKHESLATAATAVARILGGNGSRTLSVYGIHMDGVGSKTDQAKRALDQLGQKLDGQASASVDNFSGQVGILTTHVEDFVRDAAGPAGLVFQGLGAAALVTGTILDLYRSKLEITKAAQIALTASTDAGATAITAEGLSSAAAGVTMGGFGAKVAALASGPLGIAAIGVAALYAASSIGTMTDAAANNTIAFKSAADAGAAYAKQVALVQSGPKGFAGNATTNRGAALQLTTGANAGVGQFFTSLGLGGLNSQYESSADTISKIDASMTKLVAGGHAKEAADEFTKWKDAANANGISLSDLNAEFPGYTSAVAAYGKTAAGAADSTADLGTKFSVTAFNATQLKQTTDDLEKSLSNYGSTAQSAESATEGWYSSLDAATKSVKDNGKNIDDSTVKGRANNQALYSLATAADTLAAANIKAKVPLDQVKATLDAQRQSFIQVAENMGYTADAATALAAKLIGVTTTKYNFELDGVTVATNNLNDYIKALGKIPGKVTTSIVLKGSAPNAAVHTGGFIDSNGVGHFATGGGYGVFRGPGSGTSDSIPAMVSNGEYINKASTVARLGVGFFQSLNQGGTPAPVYQSAPTMAARTTIVNVSVPVSSSLIGNEDYLGKTVVTLVQKAVTNAVVSKNWND